MICYAAPEIVDWGVPRCGNLNIAAERRGLRYPSDLTDAEWALIEPMIPPGPSAAAVGAR